MENNRFEQLNNCVYCGSGNLSTLFFAPNRFGTSTEKFSLSRCDKCRTVFQNPRVKEEFIGDYYEDDLHYYKPNSENQNQGGKKFKFKSFLLKHTLINHFDYKHLGSGGLLAKLLSFPLKSKIAINIMPKFAGAHGKVLDIGCAHGANLKRLKDLGWNVAGLEMNEASAKIARGLGLDVQISKIEDATFLDQSLDAVLMCMVLEHLHNPFDSLKRITDWIKPGGELIFSIPYFEGLEFSWFREYAYGVQLPHHIVFFNKKIIKEYLSKLGYKDIKFYFHHFDRDIVGSAGFKYKDTKKYWYKLLSENKIVRRCFIRPLVYILSLMQKTSRVTVYATKIIK